MPRSTYGSAMTDGRFLRNTQQRVSRTKPSKRTLRAKRKQLSEGQLSAAQRPRCLLPAHGAQEEQRTKGTRTAQLRISMETKMTRRKEPSHRLFDRVDPRLPSLNLKRHQQRRAGGRLWRARTMTTKTKGTMEVIEHAYSNHPCFLFSFSGHRDQVSSLYRASVCRILYLYAMGFQVYIRPSWTTAAKTSVGVAVEARYVDRRCRPDAKPVPGFESREQSGCYSPCSRASTPAEGLQAACKKVWPTRVASEPYVVSPTYWSPHFPNLVDNLMASHNTSSNKHFDP